MRLGGAMILIVSFPGDLHAERVIDRLGRYDVSLHLLDLSRFPKSARLDLRYGERSSLRYKEREGAQIDFDRVGAIWWRRPQAYDFDPAMNDIGFAATECEEALSGLWSSLDARWMNPPVLDAAAHKKTYQLRVAEQIGLRMPDTLVTNSPASAAGFVQSFDRVIYKPFAGSEQGWRETRVFGDRERASLSNVRHAPVIFQEYIPGIDYRVTLVGDHVFAASIDARDASYPVDFRMNLHGVRMSPEQLPDAVLRHLRELMQRLGLVYGAIDLRRDERTGEFRFLEINPAGQFLFVEEETGLPISQGIADTLVELSQRGA